MKTVRIVVGCMLVAGLALYGCNGGKSTPSEQKINLVPDEPGTPLNYFCTWAVQNYMHNQGAAEPDPILKRVEAIGKYCADYLNEETLFGENGWVTTFYPKIRGDLYVVVDDGWDIPPGGDRAYRNSTVIWEEKFPSFSGDVPGKLKQFNDRFIENGWRGVGLWYRYLPSPLPEEKKRREAKASMDEYNKLYWGERLEWSATAGIDYWKMDLGGDDSDFRMLTALAEEKAPGLIMEHGAEPVGGPFNGYPGDGRLVKRFIDIAVERLTYADVVRLYDISPQLGIATMLERAAQVLDEADDNPAATGIINVEDEVYIAAALGAVTGIFRHPLIGLRPGGDPDIYMSGPRVLKQRIDEITRAIRWHRIAPPFPANAVEVHLSDEVLYDSWVFRMGEFWSAMEDWQPSYFNPGETTMQGAPARVSRGIPLPDVSCEGEPPFVIASRNPNGAVSVAALGRTFPFHGYFTPLADVTLDVGSKDVPIGIFGQYRSLTLLFDSPLGSVTVLGQDLAGDEAYDITSRIVIDGSTLTIPGDVIAQVGTSVRRAGDVSDPGMVIAVR